MKAFKKLQTSKGPWNRMNKSANEILEQVYYNTVTSHDLLPTIRLNDAVFLPAKFSATQPYVPASSAVADLMYSSSPWVWYLTPSTLMALPSLNHLISGNGFPCTEQMMVTLFPLETTILFITPREGALALWFEESLADGGSKMKAWRESYLTREENRHYAYD